MNTMIFSKSGAYAGIGFAVPATTIGRIVPQIIAKGHAEQLGFDIQIDPRRSSCCSEPGRPGPGSDIGAVAATALRAATPKTLLGSPPNSLPCQDAA
jgi:S1-C subfamily serine protease